MASPGPEPTTLRRYRSDAAVEAAIDRARDAHDEAFAAALATAERDYLAVMVSFDRGVASSRAALAASFDAFVERVAFDADYDHAAATLERAAFDDECDRAEAMVEHAARTAEARQADADFEWETSIVFDHPGEFDDAAAAASRSRTAFDAFLTAFDRNAAVARVALLAFVGETVATTREAAARSRAAVLAARARRDTERREQRHRRLRGVSSSLAPLSAGHSDFFNLDDVPEDADRDDADWGAVLPFSPAVAAELARRAAESREMAPHRPPGVEGSPRLACIPWSTPISRPTLVYSASGAALTPPRSP